MAEGTRKTHFLQLTFPVTIYSLAPIIILFTAHHCSNYYKLHIVGNWFAENMVQQWEHKYMLHKYDMPYFFKGPAFRQTGFLLQ